MTFPFNIDLCLNVALIFIGSAATLCAFGGDTCRKGRRPIIERITSRGWLSLLCLILALSLGVIKEYRTERDDIQKTSDAKQKQSEMTSKLADAQKQSAEANATLQGMKDTLNATQGRLKDSQTTLDDLRKSLDMARGDLTQQNSNGIISLLENSNAKVKELLLMIPFTGAVAKSLNMTRVFLPFASNTTCSKITGYSIYIPFNVANFDGEMESYGKEDNKSIHQSAYASPNNGPIFSEKDFILPPEQSHGPTVDDPGPFSPQRSFNGYVYFVGIHASINSISASDIYSHLSNPAERPFSIHVDTAYSNTGRQFDKSTAQCTRKIERYYADAFEKAIILMVLDEAEDQTIMLRLKAEPPMLVETRVSVAFKIDSPPQVWPVTIADFEKFYLPWPTTRR